MEKLRIDNIEIRQTTESSKHLYEVVCWVPCESSPNGEYCYVVAFINKHDDDDDYYVTTVGSRPWDLSNQSFKLYNKVIRAFYEITSAQ